MPLTVRYVPPKRNVIPLVHAAAELAQHAIAETILAAALPEVPVDEDVLRASGRVVQHGTSAAVTFGLDDDGTETHAPSNQYAVIVHEDMEASHPNGGGPKYLERPMHSAAGAALAAAAVPIRKALR